MTLPVLALAVAVLAGCTSSASEGGGGAGTTPTTAAVAVPATGFRSLYDDVDPFIGTAKAQGVGEAVPGGAGGDVFPGATVPFGAVQWSPDTPKAEVPYGYNHDDTTTTGFSVTHFSGAGCPNGGLFRFLPTTDPAATTASFSHADEVANPGRYRVRLADGIEVRLAATVHGGVGELTFPAGAAPTVAVDSTTFVRTITDPPLRPDGDRAIEGTETAGNFCWTGGSYPVHLRAEFDAPFTSELGPKPTVTRLRFTPKASGPTTVRVRLAISPVSVAGARANLRAEIPGWSEAEAEKAAARRWHDLLDRVRVVGGSPSQRRVFATALYHSLLHPNTWNDVDGRYPGFDGEVHTVAKGHTHFHTFSGWDIYRSQVQLLAVLAPEVARDLPPTLLDNAQRCGGGFDQWSLGNVESHVMLGDPGALMVANLAAFGADTAAPDQVLEVMRRSTDDPSTACMGRPLRPQWDEVLELGYAPRDASRTLEYAVADAAIAAYAKRHGDAALAKRAEARATNWETLFDEETGHIRGRTKQGDWMPFSGPAERNAYTEGNAAQYTWLVPQAYGRLVEVLGGRDEAAARLDDLFEDVNAGLSEPHFYMGNEPQFTVPWAYAWAGRPSGTQDTVRRIIAGAFHSGPGGLPGNDDLGATSSWLVWASLGMFPVVPGEDVLALTTPAFAKVTIDVPGREPLSITAAGTADHPYIASATLRGRPQAAAWLRYRDLRAGGLLAFRTAAEATDWGAAPSLAPPSIGARHA